MTRADRPTSHRVALVGAGGFGACWKRAIELQADVAVVAVVEPDPATREAALKEYGLHPSQCLDVADDRLARLEPSLVIDSSPFAHRLANATAAFRAGAHLLAAKPFGRDVVEATAMVDAARAHDRRITVAQQMRFFPCFLALKGLVSTRRLGGVKHVHVEMALDGRGWEPGTDWRLRLAQPLLHEAGIHHFDLMRWVLGEEISVSSVDATNPPWSPFVGPATVEAELVSQSGVRIEYRATFAPHPTKLPVRFDSGWHMEFADGSVRVVDGVVHEEGAVEAPDARFEEPVSLDELNVHVLAAALDDIDHGVDGPLSGVDNLHSMAVLHAALTEAAR